MYGFYGRNILIFSLLLLCFGCSKANSEVKVREATHADDAWYPRKASELSKTVDTYLANVKKEPLQGKVMAIIAPHAGYRFCGQVAAYAYKQIQGMNFDTVVLIGESHNYRFPGASVYESGVFRNPLGDVEVDNAITKRLMEESSVIKAIPEAHIPEHSLENQIPFLQRTLSKFKIVPILIGDSKMETSNALAKALAKVLKEKASSVLLIASTDMTHYPTYQEAVKADKYTISALETMNPDIIRDRLKDYMGLGVDELLCMLCGEEAVLAVLNTAKALGADSVKVLKYANSGDVLVGDKNKVVGYMAAAFYRSDKKDKNPDQSTSNETLDSPLNKENQDLLLKLARESIETYLRTGKEKRLETQDQRLKIKQGAFVTLRKRGNLRGCIGHIVPIEALCDTVADMAVAAAVDDPRFPKVTMDEMKDIDIEISVLSIPRRVESADEIELGKHGVIVKKGARQGVFLPQVAIETGWDKVTFLEHLCYGKAGLSKDAWKDKDTELYVFIAQLFEENKQ
jgi:AmmeMemoRadiSam system protein B/AmmeMemoRadiSam system protein A